jgi:hypothetical protein
VLAARFMIGTSTLLGTFSVWDVRRLLKEAPPPARSARVGYTFNRRHALFKVR